jgi:hypothetical protein
MNFATGLFTNRSWDIPEEIKYNKEPMNNYDNWLTDPYEIQYEQARQEEEEREYHLEQIKDMDETEINDYLYENQIEDPRE